MPAPRNLPSCSTYRLVDSYHTGGLENAEVCANCGRAIVEVAVLEDAQLSQHRVGMDCAQTICAAELLTAAQAGFSESRALAAKIRKARKADPVGQLSVHEYGPATGYYRQGGFSVQFGAGPDSIGYFWKNYPVEMRPYLIRVIEIANQAGVIAQVGEFPSARAAK